MSINFIFSNLNIIELVVWAALFIVVVLRFMRRGVAPNGLTRHDPAGSKNISFSVLIAFVIGLHIFYGAFVTWGQYYVWNTSGEYTKTFISAPLPEEVPLGIFEGLRANLEQPLGYFSYYVFGRIWLDIIILFALAGFFYSILKIWSLYRGGFLPHGPEILLVLMLISGYPGILILVPLGFTLAFASFGISYAVKLYKEIKLPRPYTIPTFSSSVREAVSVVKCSPVYLEPSFLIATPIALLFGGIIFAYLS